MREMQGNLKEKSSKRKERNENYVNNQFLFSTEKIERHIIIMLRNTRRLGWKTKY
jgi:hypothetical protein